MTEQISPTPSRPWLPTCESSCHGDCNQGRNCDCAGDDPMAPARGIFNALLLSIPLWGLIALAYWWLA